MSAEPAFVFKLGFDLYKKFGKTVLGICKILLDVGDFILNVRGSAVGNNIVC